MLDLLGRLERYNEFVASINEELWDKQVAPGKWMVKDVIAHLWHWDDYTLNFMVPQMQDAAMLPEFPDHDEHMRRQSSWEKGSKTRTRWYEPLRSRVRCW